MDPLWCTVNAKILLFLVDKSVNIHDFSANYIHTTQIPENFCHTIIISSRRRSIKTTKKILENYEYTGHSLDTISAWFFRLLGNDFLRFYYALCAFWSQQISKIKQISCTENGQSLDTKAQNNSMRNIFFEVYSRRKTLFFVFLNSDNS